MNNIFKNIKIIFPYFYCFSKNEYIGKTIHKIIKLIRIAVPPLTKC